jgi:hypothetical protein
MKKEDLKNYDPIIEDNIEIGNREIIVRPTKNDGEETDIELCFDFDIEPSEDERGASLSVSENTFQDSGLFSDELKSKVNRWVQNHVEEL